MSILRDSCAYFSRAVLIVVNLVIYLALYGLVGTMPDENMQDRDIRGRMAENVEVKPAFGEPDTPSLVENKVIVLGEPDSFNSAIDMAYFGQGYQQAKEDLWGLEMLRRRA